MTAQTLPPTTPAILSPTPTRPEGPSDVVKLRPLEALCAPKARLDVSRIDLAMTETIALSPPRIMLAPSSPHRSPSPSSSPPPWTTGPPPLLDRPAAVWDADLEAQPLGRSTIWADPRWPARPALAAALGTFVPAVAGMMTFWFFDGVQALTQTETCDARAMDGRACLVSLSAGVVVTASGWRQSPPQDNTAQLARRVARISAVSHVGAALCSSLGAALSQTRNVACFVPVTFRSVGSTAVVLALGLDFSAPPPERLDAATQLATVPVVCAARALRSAAKRIWRRRWH